MGFWLTLVYLLISVVSLLYVLLKVQYQYWAKRGVPYMEPIFPSGLRTKVNGKRIHFTEVLDEIYKKFKNSTPFTGVFFFFRPIALVTDLELVHNVMVKDFNTFHDRGIFYNERDDPISAHLFSMEGNKWKNLRAKLTPTFTSGKMKFMYPTIVKVADEFDRTLDELVKKDGVLEIKDLLARFTTDVIGTCAFGIECNTLKDPDAEFRKAGRLALERPRGTMLRALITQFPDLAIKLGVKSLRKEVSRFFMRVVKETVEMREKNDVHRNDFMDLLIQLKNAEASSELGNLTLKEIAAQSFLFFLAGFETSSTTMTFSLYELVMNPEIQEKARQEVNDVLEKYNGEFTYEAMMDMQYLDCIINETLRKHPPVVSLMRVASQDYTVPDSNKVIEKGMRVFIPVYSIHHDPDIYPDPEKFDPNRFMPEEKKNRRPIAFLGFGDGPRNCIGSRFGQMQSRVGLVTMLRNYRFKVCSKTLIPMKYSLINPVLSPDGGMWLEFEKI